MKVWVRIDDEGNPLEIFRSHAALLRAMPYMEDGPAIQMDRKTATGKIRDTIFARQHGLCLQCGAVMTLKTMHMHERVSRGAGGNISLDNSEGLCYFCHLEKQHGNRKPQFKKVLDKQNEL